MKHRPATFQTACAAALAMTIGLLGPGGCALPPFPYSSGTLDVSTVDDLPTPPKCLRIGQTTETELLFTFGAPSGRFDHDRVMTWRLVNILYIPRAELWPVAREVGLTTPYDQDELDRGDDSVYDLVVVLDDRGIVCAFRLLRVRTG